jgi:acetyl-CoA carboxylase carboxyltransferase component
VLAAEAELVRRRRLAAHVGGPEAVRRQHERGLLTALERVDLLLDPGSHVEFGPLVHADDLATAEQTFGDGELAGFGTIDGRWVAYFASDARVKGASGTPATFRHAEAFRAITERAALPLFHLQQGGGARMNDAMSSTFLAFPGTGLGSRRAFGRRGVLLTAALGNYFAPWSVPQADFSVMTRAGNISLTAPPLVEVGTGQRVTAEELGGSAVQARISGQIDAVVEDDAAAIAMLRRVFSYLPSRAGELPPAAATDDPVDRRIEEWADLVPERLAASYDIRLLIREIVDDGSFIEWSPEYAPNMVTGLARFGGQPAVVMANQPMHLAGVVDVKATIKATRILKMAADLSMPLVSLIDTPGVLPTKEQEHDRLMTHLFDFGVLRLKVDAPKVVVIVRKAIGFAMQAMSAGDPEALTVAWPGAQIAFTGPEAAARVVYRREIEDAADPRAKALELATEFTGGAEPWAAARLGYLDDIIDPADTRRVITSALLVWRRT